MKSMSIDGLDVPYIHPCIKSIAVNSSTTIDVSTGFCKEKMLMFAKMSVKSSVCDIIEDFGFPDDKVKGIFDKSDNEKKFFISSFNRH